MPETTKTSISIPKTLSTQAEALAHQLKISRSRLFGMALADFIRSHPGQPIHPPDPEPPGERRIHQGDLYWLQLEDPGGLEPGIPHPHVVLQEDVFNHSRIRTVVVCALTSNLKRTSLPGSVLLEAGEANLPLPSVVEVSKVSTVDKTQLGEYIGSLSDQRISQILSGMRFLQQSFSPDH